MSTMPKPKVSIAARLTALGFGVVETGGGCSAWRIALPAGGYVLITDTGGCSADLNDDSPLTIGVYDAKDECVAISCDDE